MPLKRTPLKRASLREPVDGCILRPPRKPVKKKRAKARRGRTIDRKYLAFIASRPCLICGRSSGVEVAHVGDRGLGQKASDRETLPLCVEHHRTGPRAHHVLGRKFWEEHGISREDEVRRYNEEFEAGKAA